MRAPLPQQVRGGARVAGPARDEQAPMQGLAAAGGAPSATDAGAGRDQARGTIELRHFPALGGRHPRRHQRMRNALHARKCWMCAA